MGVTFADEVALTGEAERVLRGERTADALARELRSHRDPLGERLCASRSPEQRRALGATYTPAEIVASMVDWAARRTDGESPRRIVDPGAGSGRFLLSAARRFPRAELVGIELDPLAALIARANLAAAGLADRSHIHVCDYRSLRLPPVAGRTLFIGNPPYLRHHKIEARWKQWLVDTAGSHDLRASRLAGLHLHFLLATLLHAREGDLGCFITAAEWLDVNYGRLARELFLGKLGGCALALIDPELAPFPDATTTAVILGFEVGTRPREIRVRRARSLRDLSLPATGRAYPRSRLVAEERWSRLTAPRRRRPEGQVELGELCRVHRGQVTGANRVWIAGQPLPGLPDRLLRPCVTRAREVIAAGPVLSDASSLRRVVDLPEDLDALVPEARAAVDAFLVRARLAGAHCGYVARHRRAWWSVGLRAPAPILATYMARRAPAFTRNRARVHHLNIAHGLYPRESLDPGMLDRLVDHLSRTISRADGRTYAGGLTKFEPRELERVWVPEPARLRAPLGVQ